MAPARFPVYPDLTGKVVLVTGGGHGIGAAIVRAFAAQGCHVAVNYHRSARQAASLAAALRRKGVKAAAYRADVRDPLDVCSMTGRVRSDLGPVTILVNNAAIMLPGKPFDRTTWPDFEAELDAALKGAFLCAQAVLKDMRKARRGPSPRPVGGKGHPKGGSIVNIITTMVDRPIPRFSPHIVAKSALLGFTRALAVELGPFGITVNAVSPGYTLSGMTARMPGAARKRLVEASPTGSLSRPEDVAAAVLFLASSPQVTGQCLVVDGGMSLAA